MEKINYDELPEADVVVNYICKRKKQGLYTLIFASGLPGSGKSSQCQRVAELVSIELTGENRITEEHIFDDLLGLLKFIQEADPKEVNIGVIEEVSVLFPSRRAMAADNVAIGKILDTARKKEVILFANAPIWTSIESHLRALGNIYLETLRINKTDCVVISKALRLQTNPGSGKTYFHWLNRKGCEVQRIFTRKPNKEVWAKYESKKDKFMNKLYAELSFKAKKTRDKLDKEMEGVHSPPIKALTSNELQVHQLSSIKGLKQKEIAEKMGIAQQRVSQIRRNILKKTKNDMKLSDISPIS